MIITITKEIKKSFISIEALLMAELDYDQHNSEHIVRLLNKAKCEDILSTCVLNQYCTTIYIDLVYPIYMYLEYINNFLTVDCFAAYMDIELEAAQDYIGIGASYLDKLNSVDLV
jgi:hypothetical protein